MYLLVLYISLDVFIFERLLYIALQKLTIQAMYMGDTFLRAHFKEIKAARMFEYTQQSFYLHVIFIAIR